MTIVQLEYLLSVVNCGSFSTAAKECFVTQPSLSMQIKALEEEIGATLLDRSHKPVIPTQIGEVVVAHAREAVSQFHRVKESVFEMQGATVGKLRLGVIPTISPYLLHKFIPTFVSRYPQVELEVCDMVTNDIIDALKSDRIDAALVAGDTCGEGITEIPLFHDRFYLYISPENRLFNQKKIEIKDIDISELVLLSNGNCMRDQVLELCIAKRDNPSHYSFVSGSIDTLMRIVDCTSSLTIIPEMAIEYIPANRRERVRMLWNENPSRTIAVAVRRSYVKKTIINALNNTILDCIKPSESIYCAR